MRQVSSTRRRRKSTPPCSITASTTARSARCIASSSSTPKCANAALSCATPSIQKPELLAEGPNKVWSWDITKLMGPAKWTYFYLYVILDIFSRRVVGWCVADAETREIMIAPAMTPFQVSEVAPGTDRTTDDEILDWVKQAAE